MNSVVYDKKKKKVISNPANSKETNKLYNKLDKLEPKRYEIRLVEDK